jgi:FAD synthetase
MAKKYVKLSKYFNVVIPKYIVKKLKLHNNEELEISTERNSIVLTKPMHRKKVLMFGSFDLLHPGHIQLFRQGKKLGDHLTVVVARNSTIKKVKGMNPRYDEKDRLSHVKELSVVDEAVLGNEKDKYQILSIVKPQVICLGYDQVAFTDKLESELRKRKIKAKIVRIKPYKEHKYKSSKLKY